MKEKHINQKSVLDGVPKYLPALIRALKIQKKAAGVGFDWSSPSEIVKKIEEELRELRITLKNAKSKDLKNELGDLLFSVVNLIRFLDFDVDSILHDTTKKFIKRFRYIEKTLRQKKIPLKKANLKLMESLWQESKR